MAGLNNVIVRATDVAGNTKDTAFSFTLDTSTAAPVVALTSDTRLLRQRPHHQCGYAERQRLGERGDGQLQRQRRLDLHGQLRAVAGLNNVIVRATDVAGNTKDTAFSFTLDTVNPAVTNVSSAPSSGTIGAGQKVLIYLTASEAVTVTGAPTLTLNDGGTAGYDAASSNLAAGIIAFDYISKLGESTNDLKITALTLGSGDAINDMAGNALNTAGAVNADLGLVVNAAATVIESFGSTT